MKYLVKYEVKSGDKTLINPGLADFNTSVELTSKELKEVVKEWLSAPDKPVISEVLKLNNKELLDTDVISFSGRTNLNYLLTLSGDTGTQSLKK